MTLAARLALSDRRHRAAGALQAQPMGRGFVMYAELLPQPARSLTWRPPLRQVNEAMEHVIRQSPGQYLWAMAAASSPEPMPLAAAASSLMSRLGV